MKSDSFVSMAVMITVATVVLSVIDASMIVNHGIGSEKIQPNGFVDWAAKIPWWWIIVIIILVYLLLWVY